MIRIGLIGDNIARSEAWRLHGTAGRLCGLDVSYRNLLPAELGKGFDAVFSDCAHGGYAGLNITHPYKQRVMVHIAPGDAAVKVIGAANTVVFTDKGPVAYNTDATGYAAAFRASFPVRRPGSVALVGAGGAGRAVAHALLTLGASELRVFDTNTTQAAGLVAAFREAAGNATLHQCATVQEAIEDADGLVNCTPIGMTGYAGSAIPLDCVSGGGWASDAIYTPRETEFLKVARQAGRSVMGGYELFFYQGVEGFRFFTGHDVPADLLREALRDVEAETATAAPR